jgi:hypothetical protein
MTEPTYFTLQNEEVVPCTNFAIIGLATIIILMVAGAALQTSNSRISGAIAIIGYGTAAMGIILMLVIPICMILLGV